MKEILPFAVDFSSQEFVSTKIYIVDDQHYQPEADEQHICFAQTKEHTLSLKLVPLILS